MAVQNSDGKYVGAHGSLHDNAGSAGASIRAAAEGSAAQFQFLGGLTSAVIPAMLAGLIAMLILIAAAGFRGAWILVKEFWLYPAVALATIFTFVFLLKSLRRPVLGFLLGIVAAVAVCVFGFKGATNFYANQNKYYASVYSADFIHTLPDGTTPILYEKRNKKGDEIAKLSVGEKVTVNGISFNEQEFSITTAGGLTGWVEREAFPEDAREMLAINIGLNGVNTQELAIDRQTERLMERYMDVEETGGYKNEKGYDVIKRKSYSLNKGVMNRFTKTDAEAPVMYVGRKPYKKGAELADVGVKAKLAGILYADECTVLHLTVNDIYDKKGTKPYFWCLYGPQNATAWKTSLTVTDLDTGEKWKVLPADYQKTYSSTHIGNDHSNRISSVLFFFPPFKSNHFSIAHEESPLPDKGNTGYGGILGWMSKLTGNDGETDYYLDYSFPEVRVRR